MASKLYVDQAPAAFSNWAAKYNNLVYLIRTMQGRGCDIKVSDSQIIISVSAGTSGSVPDPLTIGTIYCTDFYSTWATVSYLSAGVVTFDTLYSVSAGVDYFHCYDSATFVDAFAISATVNRLDSTTFSVDSINCTDSATFVDAFAISLTANRLDSTTFNVDAINCTDSATFVDLYSTTITANYADIEGNFRVLNGGSYSCSIPAASVTRNMTIKEIDVCYGGVAKKMLILASDPY